MTLGVAVSCAVGALVAIAVGFQSLHQSRGRQLIQRFAGLAARQNAGLGIQPALQQVAQLVGIGLANGEGLEIGRAHV